MPADAVFSGTYERARGGGWCVTIARCYTGSVSVTLHTCPPTVGATPLPKPTTSRMR